ncbi:MAG TPA: LamG-like jellyroll fold domain-containing protein, partial [Chthoniobacterales bacterium]|nr:LamG-like jellyroll fold domain-containing protein [Chthoniobacterales bacterium]
MQFGKLFTASLLAVLLVTTSRAADVGPYNGEFLAEGIFGIAKPITGPAPIQADKDWTMNVWVKPDHAPQPKTLIAGFGNISDNSGQQRYFANFEDGLRFWGGSIDVSMKQPLETGRWQMLTAVHSAGTLKLYKNGALSATQPVALTDAKPEIHLAPNSNWPGGNHFGGRIALFTITDRALSDPEVRALQKSGSGLDQLDFPKGAPEHWGLQAPGTGQNGNPNQDPASFPKSATPVSPARKATASPRAPFIPDHEGGMILGGKWQMIEAPKVSVDGTAISKPGFPSANWYAATVPGTVLTTLVNQGVYPHPYFGLNNLAIPETLNKQDYWYRLEFAPPAMTPGQTSVLTFLGINYHAEIWLNGQRLGEIAGAFKRGIFDVSKIIKPGTSNALAVRVSPPPHPGIPHEQSMQAGAGPNGGAMVADGPTFFCTEGWDWIPGIRDRDTGIWQDVVLKVTDAVTLGDPQILTRIPEPVGSRADVAVMVEVANRSAVGQSGVLKGAFEGVSFEKPVTLAAGERRTVTFAPAEFPQLAVAKPRLWWPNGYGRPELYHLSLSFQGAGGKVSETKNLRFGMREISVVLSALNSKQRVGRYEFFPLRAGSNQVIKNNHESLVATQNGWMPSLAEGAENSPALKESSDTETERYLVIKVNGQRIVIRGGNWGMDDAMKQVSRDHLEPYFRLQRDANFNTIRNWCGQSTEET